MKFKILGLENELPLTTGINCVLIKNVKFYQKFVYHLLNGNPESLFGLVAEDGEYIDNIFKYFEYIQNPYCIKLDDRKLLNAFYKDLSTQIISDDELYSEIRTKISELQVILQKLESDLDFSIETNENIGDVLKYFNVTLKRQGESLIDNLYQYIDIYSRWFKGTGLLFFNCLNLFTYEEISELNKYAGYHNLKLLFIEMSDFNAIGINKLTIFEDFSDSLALNDAGVV